MATSFARVQEILNGAVEEWAVQHGRPANLKKHSIGFGWQTRDQLTQTTVRGLVLVEDSHISNQTGDQSNLVLALRAGIAPYPRMPIGGPYLPDAEIGEIVDWINNGASA